MYSEPRSMAQVMAVASGKGGVGKTNVAINLAMALSARGRAVTLMDADLGLANIDVLLNLRPLRNLSHLIEGDCTLRDILIDGPGDVRIIPAASGIRMMSQLTAAQHVGLVHAFDDIVNDTDYLIVDTAAGISDSVVRFCSAAQEILVVVCNDPASIADAYALVKTLNKEHQLQRFSIVVNKVKTEAEGILLFERLCAVTEQYLDVVLKLNTIIPDDNCIQQAARKRQAFYLAYPHAKAIKAFKKMALDADTNMKAVKSSGRLTFFAAQMLGTQVVQESRAMS